MALNAGDANCTSGLSKRIYDKWTNDSRAGLISPLAGDAQGSVRAICFAIATAVVDEITTNARTAQGEEKIV